VARLRPRRAMRCPSRGRRTRHSGPAGTGNGVNCSRATAVMPGITRMLRIQVSTASRTRHQVRRMYEGAMAVETARTHSGKMSRRRAKSSAAGFGGLASDIGLGSPTAKHMDCVHVIDLRDSGTA
jgi:hypothetical protein